MITSQDDHQQNLSARHNSKLALKINANYIDCTYEHNDADSWRKQVENYCGYPCYVYSVRPVTLNNTK